MSIMYGWLFAQCFYSIFLVLLTLDRPAHTQHNEQLVFANKSAANRPLYPLVFLLLLQRWFQVLKQCGCIHLLFPYHCDFELLAVDSLCDKPLLLPNDRLCLWNVRKKKFCCWKTTNLHQCSISCEVSFVDCLLVCPISNKQHVPVQPNNEIENFFVSLSVTCCVHSHKQRSNCSFRHCRSTLRMDCVVCNSASIA